MSFKKSFLNRLKPIAIGSAMADMALLLLVFFMATTTSEPPKGVEVDLPIATTAGAEQDSFYITISKYGKIYYDGHLVTEDQLNDNLAMRQSEKDRVVAITAHKDLDYSIISRLLNILREQDFLNVVFMAQPRDLETVQK